MDWSGTIPTGGSCAVDAEGNEPWCISDNDCCGKFTYNGVEKKLCMPDLVSKTTVKRLVNGVEEAWEFRCDWEDYAYDMTTPTGEETTEEVVPVDSGAFCEAVGGERPTCQSSDCCGRTHPSDQSSNDREICFPAGFSGKQYYKLVNGEEVAFSFKCNYDVEDYSYDYNWWEKEIYEAKSATSESGISYMAVPYPYEAFDNWPNKMYTIGIFMFGSLNYLEKTELEKQSMYSVDEITPEMVAEYYFNDPAGVNGYFKEASYGKVGFQGYVAGYIDLDEEFEDAMDMSNDRDRLYSLYVNQVTEIPYDHIDIWILFGWTKSGGD